MARSQIAAIINEIRRLLLVRMGIVLRVQPRKISLLVDVAGHIQNSVIIIVELVHLEFRGVVDHLFHRP